MKSCSPDGTVGRTEESIERGCAAFVVEEGVVEREGVEAIFEADVERATVGVIGTVTVIAFCGG